MKTQGDSLFDIVDKRDHSTVQAQLLHGTGAETQPDRQLSFFCRMNMSRTLKRQGGFGDVKVSLANQILCLCVRQLLFSCFSLSLHTFFHRFSAYYAYYACA